MRRQLGHALLWCALCGPALAADVAGTWTISGQIQPSCTITQNGNQLSGSCKGPQAEGPLTGTSDGQTVQFIFRRTGQRGGQMAPVRFTGTVAGDSMSGTLAMGKNAGTPFTARREGAAPAAALASAQPLQAAAPPSPAIDKAPPRTVWDTDLDGSAIHQQTGMVCPGASGPLKRDGLTMYDKVGFDVSCNYDMAGARITIYLTMRDPALLQRSFEGARDAVVKNTPGAVPRAGTLAAPPGLSWLQAAFDEQGGAVRSDVLYAQLSGWEYEIRASFRPDNEAVVTAAIADLTATVRRTAAPRLAACAAAGRATDGSGQRNRDLTVLQALAMASAAITKLTVTTPQPGAVWCPDIGFGLGAGDYVWWRNIAAGDDGPVARVSAIRGDSRTIFLVRVPAEVSRAVAEKVGGAAALDGKPSYALAVDEAQSTRIAAIFNGVPPFKEVSALLLQQSFGVYAEIRKPEGAVTVYAPF